MLTATRGQKTCHSCRSQLLALFEHGFTISNPRIVAPRRVISNRSSLLNRYYPREFSTYNRWRSQDVDHSRPAENISAGFVEDGVVPKDDTVEETVRHARQTFGETLPKDFLSEEEYKLYERLYGPPVRETTAEDLEFLEGVEEEDGVADQQGRNILLKENEDGEYEEVEYDLPELENMVGRDDEAISIVEGSAMDGSVQVLAQSQREADAILRLQKDMDIASVTPAEEQEIIEETLEEEEDIEEEEDEDWSDEPDAIFSGDHARTHPRTMAGRWGTYPMTLNLPEEQFIIPITVLLDRTNNKHLSEAAERAFGGPGLPHSSSTPGSKKLLPQKHIGLEPGQHKMSEIEADAYIAGVMPGVFTAVTSALVEVRKRLGSSWLRDLLFREGGEGPRVLDAGAGGAGLIAWRSIVQAEWDVLREEGMVSGVDAPDGKATVVTGPKTLRERMSLLLQNTTFLPRLPDYIHSAHPENLLDGAPAQSRKVYDVVIAPHTLFPLKEEFKRKHMVENLWQLLDPNGGVLILLEKGLPRGFEAVAGARSLILKNYISSPTSTHNATPLDSPVTEPFTEKETGMIIAPCTNHTSCPMYKTEGFSPGRKDFCHFSQRFTRPPFLQRLLGAKQRNHEDVKFSYLAVRRGIDTRASDTNQAIAHGEAATEVAFKGFETPFTAEDGLDAVYGRDTADVESVDSDAAFSPLALPRAILPPIKRRGHVTLDLCTPSGTIERWTVPKSFSNQAYRDARKSKHGDLWALGAKTRTIRNVRLGRALDPADDGETGWKKGKKGDKTSKTGKSAGRNKKDVYEVQVGETGMESIREMKGGRIDKGKRTKDGRVRRKGRDLSKEMGDDVEEDDGYDAVLKEILNESDEPVSRGR
jgi:ribosomal protein RSM22 (predicted rRNA methylase)